MTMIAVGQGLRGIANKGMGAVARAESVENQQRMGIEAQKTAAESQTYGTAAGIGGMVGAGNMAANTKAATDAVGVLNTGIKGIGSASLEGGSLSFTPAGGEVLKGAEAAKGLSDAASTADGTLKTLETVKAGTEVVTAGAEVATAGESLVAANAAAGSTGTMATLSTLAAPIAIGLGVAFLLNKLFD